MEMYARKCCSEQYKIVFVPLLLHGSQIWILRAGQIKTEVIPKIINRV